MKATRFSRYGSLNSRTCQTSSLPMPMVWTWSKDKYLKRLTNTFRRPSTQLMHRLRWKIMLPIELLPFGMTDHRQALCTLMANLRFWSRDAWSWAIIGTSQSLCIVMVTSLIIPSESTLCWKATRWRSLARATGRDSWVCWLILVISEKQTKLEIRRRTPFMFNRRSALSWNYSRWMSRGWP